MNNINLTVAIPTYDRESYLRQTLESLQSQAERSFKVMLFDNASPYDIKSLMSQFPSLSITLERNSTNVGNQANFERVMSYKFDTPYVMIFHDDDTIHPQYFKDALQVLEKDQNLNWLGSYIRYTHYNNKMMSFGDAPINPQSKIYNKRELADAFMDNAPIGFSSVIYRKEALANTSPNNESFHKWLDRPFMLEACGEKKVAVMTFPYINYRIHTAQDSAQTYKEHIPAMINLTGYISSAGSPSTGRKYATTNALRTAIQNASSVKEFISLLMKFKERGLYRTVDIRPYSIYWLFRIWAKKLPIFTKIKRSSQFKKAGII